MRVGSALAPREPLAHAQRHLNQMVRRRWLITDRQPWWTTAEAWGSVPVGVPTMFVRRALGAKLGLTVLRFRELS